LSDIYFVGLSLSFSFFKSLYFFIFSAPGVNAENLEGLNLLNLLL
jgi:hypothetical protein